MLLEARGIIKAFGAFRAVDGADLDVRENEIIGLIGPNGAGKSTFFNCLAGDAQPTAGSIRFLGQDVTRATPEAHARLGMARSFQVPVTFEDMTVIDNVMVGAFLRHPHRAAARAVGEEVLDFTGLSHLAGSPARSLGTPGRKRLEIARALATEPRLLLLDEALAGLTPAEVRLAIELVRRIKARGITIVIVEHIMEVILSLAERAVVFHQGRVIAEGVPRAVVEDPAVVAAYLGHSMEAGAAVTGPLLSVANLAVRYGDLVGVADVSLAVPDGAVVALLGSNGAGKTTTLNAIAGLVPPAGGSVVWRGQAITGQPAYAIVNTGLALAPEGWRLFVQQTVEQNLRLGATVLADKRRVPALLDRVFALFPRLAERRRQRAGTLSGGERQMLATGRALMSDPKLLMLDEPSLGLAPAVVESMYATLGRLRREGLTLLLAEQAVELALEVADYAYVLQTGRTVLQGPAAELADDKEVQRIYLGLVGG